MSKQYHYVVMYDSKTQNWVVEYEMTDNLLNERESSVYDTETYQWSSADEDEAHEDYGTNLGVILIHANAKRGKTE
jgi:hypothetical protein